MILDTLSNAARYNSVHPLFEKAFAFIQSNNLGDMEEGKYEIDGDKLIAAVFEKGAKTQAEANEKFECHDKHIDIQVLIKGKESIGWKPREKCTEVKGAYNPEKDVSFYVDQPEMYFGMEPGQFAILYPEDVHSPMIGEGSIKKMVVKVKI
ncbi:YhcH/YjgK/YiaL family protein [Cyclobacterium amurskyense]|uniref:Putative beta-D-galactosidase n=1 Tax=Cyclobacterium amurskyense TaxID=320787 RepID=A0A0H4PK90_9BACT|nr:YhcH/YjgK/YiaL family protein [Cyclobacterium amurskyense]AKP53408.1 Putative beta-D-galactosidase [Cyclobacterium amurskyense]|tara:strand:+ start:7894 stop:8346 length:453 start_codon:yes stop_codon:yes gene_type:complete